MSASTSLPLVKAITRRPVSASIPDVALGASDLDRLLRIRDLLDAPDAAIVLASVAAVDPSLTARPDLIAIEPADVYA